MDSLSPSRPTANPVLPNWHKFLPETASHLTFPMLQQLSSLQYRYIEQLIYRSPDDPDCFIPKPWQIIQPNTGAHRGPVPKWFRSLQSMIFSFLESGPTIDVETMHISARPQGIQMNTLPQDKRKNTWIVFKEQDELILAKVEGKTSGVTIFYIHKDISNHRMRWVRS